MANRGKETKRAAKDLVGSTSTGPSQYVAGGKKIVCPHCGGDEFAKSKAQLNTAAMTFFRLDWANKSATTLACTQCSRIQWFLKEPEQRSS